MTVSIGIGLYLARKSLLCKMDILVESEVGCGSTFASTFQTKVRENHSFVIFLFVNGL